MTRAVNKILTGTELEDIHMQQAIDKHDEDGPVTLIQGSMSKNGSLQSPERLRVRLERQNNIWYHS